MHLTEAEYIKKRWQEYTEELCKQSLTNPDNHEDVLTHLKPDVLECEEYVGIRPLPKKWVEQNMGKIDYEY